MKARLVVRVAGMICLLSMLAACTYVGLGGRSQSAVDAQVLPADYDAIAGAVAAIVKTRLPPGSSTVVGVKSGRTIDDAITRSLRDAGYALEDAKADDHGSHSLRYSITTIDGQIVVMLWIDRVPIARAYGHDATGALTPASAIANRDAP